MNFLNRAAEKSFVSILGQVRGFQASSNQLARHSNIRRGRAVCDPPSEPAFKSKFFDSLPTYDTFYNKNQLRDKARSKYAQFNATFENKPSPNQEIEGYQFGISKEEEDFLVNKTPDVIGDHSLQSLRERSNYVNQAKLVMQSVSLATSGGKEITAFNTKKCIEKFGKNEADTGSPEVQAAIWTLRIRNLERHFEDNHKDVHNRRRLVQMYHKRAKIMKYLKRQSLERYHVTLKSLGVTPEMVEGEISIRQKHV